MSSSTSTSHALYLRPALGALMIVAGFVLSQLPQNQAWCLWLNHELAPWPALWMALSWSALGITAMLVLVACSADEPRRVGAWLLALLIGGLVVHLIKRTMAIDRPLAVFGPDHPQFHVIGEALRKGALPSGHSATAWTLACLMTMGQDARRAWWRHGFWLLAALQALSRVAVGAHWPADALVGAGLGLTLAPLVWRLPASEAIGRWLARPLMRRVMAALLPLLGLGLCLAKLGWAVPLWCQAGVMALSLYGAWRWLQAARVSAPLSVPVSAPASATESATESASSS